MSDRPPGADPPGTITVRLRRAHLWVVGAILIALGAGFLLGRATDDQPQAVLYAPPASAPSSQAPGATSATPTAPDRSDLAGHPSRGPDDAALTMVEFIDFECPFCGSYARDTLPRIERDYGDRVRYVSVQFPLSIHPHAEEAARAAICADDQGVYWRYHELLFAHQDQLDRSGLTELAGRAGADRASFADCLASPAVRQRVAADVALGNANGVASTPTLFVGDEPLVGALPFAQFKSTLDGALGESG